MIVIILSVFVLGVVCDFYSEKPFARITRNICVVIALLFFLEAAL